MISIEKSTSLASNLIPKMTANHPTTWDGTVNQLEHQGKRNFDDVIF